MTKISYMDIVKNYGVVTYNKIGKYPYVYQGILYSTISRNPIHTLSAGGDSEEITSKNMCDKLSGIMLEAVDDIEDERS